MEGAFATTNAFAVPSRTQPARREYTVRITKELRETLNALAHKYNLYTAEGTPRDAEIVRVLLVCALTEGWAPREQAAVALYVNGLMLVAQGLWLGLYDIRTDLAEVIRLSVGLQEEITSPTEPERLPRDRNRLHIRVDTWMRNRIVAAAIADGFVHENGVLRDGMLVSMLVQRAVECPAIYRHAFVVYARGIAQVRSGLMEGLTTVRDALRAAVVTTAGGG
jgi:hypothetical protein